MTFCATSCFPRGGIMRLQGSRPAGQKSRFFKTLPWAGPLLLLAPLAFASIEALTLDRVEAESIEGYSFPNGMTTLPDGRLAVALTQAVDGKASWYAVRAGTTSGKDWKNLDEFQLAGGKAAKAYDVAQGRGK